MSPSLFRIYENDILRHVRVRNNSPPTPPPRPPSLLHPELLEAPIISKNAAAKQRSTTIEYTRRTVSGLMGLKIFSEIFLSCLVLICTVFSKLSLVGLTDDLSEVSRLVTNGSGSDPSTVARAVALYWQLLLILLIPNFVTFLRCMLFGCLGKSGSSFPFPTKMALIAVSF